jgi:uncharacterized protein (DUF2062 family)
MASDYDSTGTGGGMPWPVMVAIILALAVAVWLAVGLIFATLRFAFAIAGYIIVAFLAYQVGKWVGRSSSGPEP